MNGHKNWNHWNVSLWLFNDEGLYRWMRSCVRVTSTKDDAARRIMESLGEQETPDGAPYTYTSVRAALAHWEG
mgnify:FL=1